jgi:hypothetical protein
MVNIGVVFAVTICVPASLWGLLEYKMRITAGRLQYIECVEGKYPEMNYGCITHARLSEVLMIGHATQIRDNRLT